MLIIVLFCFCQVTDQSARASLSLALSNTALSLSSVGVTFATMNATITPAMNPGRSSYTPVEAEQPSEVYYETCDDTCDSSLVVELSPEE